MVEYRDIQELPTYNNGSREVLKDFFKYHPKEFDPMNGEPRNSDRNIDHLLSYLWNRGFKVEQKQMGDLQARAVADQQRMVAAAQAQADKIVAAARSDAEQKSKQAAQAFVDMQKKVNDLASQHAAMLTEIEKAAARLDAMKKTAREFAGA